MRWLANHLLAAGLALALAACATVDEGGPTAAPPSTDRVYPGAGRDPSLLGAMNEAKMDAVRLAVVDLVGAAVEQANHAALVAGLYATRDPNVYVVSEGFTATLKGSIGGEYLVEATVPVRREAVVAALEKLGLMRSGKAVTTGTAAPAAGPAAAGSPSPGTAAPGGTTGGGATGGAPAKAEAAAPPLSAADEERIIRAYVERMTWLVYYAERTGLDRVAMQAAVGAADEYLAEQRMTAVDLARVERLKKDQQKAWQAETGGSVGIVPWIARKLEVDVYLEIDAETTVTRSKQGWSAAATIVARIHDAATGRLLAAVPWANPASAWLPSEAEAVASALQASVRTSMPIAVGLAKARFTAELRGGIRYGLTLQRPATAEAAAAFRERLAGRVRQLRVVSESATETTFEVRLVGTLDDLAGLVAAVAAKVPGLETLKKVQQTARTVTFSPNR